METRYATLLVLIACAGWGTLPAGAAAATPTVEHIALQIALEREGFSPGLIDGLAGKKTTAAIREFQLARKLSPTGQTDSETVTALRIPEASAALTTYTILPADVQKVAPPPKSWAAKSKARYLGYNSLAEAVAEKFHCSRALLASLNKGINLSRLKAGDRLTVPAVQAATLPAADRLEVSFTQKTIRAVAKDGRPVALFHCSIAAKQEKLPKRDTRIVGITHDPAYRFDPAMWPEVRGVDRKLMIPPGPRSPVGVCWIALGLPGYGMHGTPNPELIGKTGSHGCFRLTNWDATRLGKMVRAGTPVQFTKTGA